MVTTADQATLCNKEKADLAPSLSQALNLSVHSRPDELSFIFRISFQSYRTTFTMADSDLAPNFAPFFSFVSGIVSSKLENGTTDRCP